MKERHAQILEAIKSFYQENGFCPTVRQIGDMVGLKSTSTVITHLKAMEKAGLIIRNEFSPRSIIIPGFNDRNPKMITFSVKLKRKTPVLNRFSYCMDSGLPAMMLEWMSLQSLRILNISGRE